AGLIRRGERTVHRAFVVDEPFTFSRVTGRTAHRGTAGLPLPALRVSRCRTTRRLRTTSRARTVAARDLPRFRRVVSAPGIRRPETRVAAGFLPITALMLVTHHEGVTKRSRML